MPSLILYSCPQLPQTSFPSLTDVSRRRVCRSRIVFSSSVEGGVSVGTSAVGGGDKDEQSRADDEDAGGSGFDSGIVKPSYWDLISREALFPPKLLLPKQKFPEGCYTHLAGRYPYSIPIQSRENALQEFWVVCHFNYLELRISVVEGKRSGRGFAALDGAGEEGSCKDLHLEKVVVSFHPRIGCIERLFLVLSS